MARLVLIVKTKGFLEVPREGQLCELGPEHEFVHAQATRTNLCPDAPPPEQGSDRKNHGFLMVKEVER